MFISAWMPITEETPMARYIPNGSRALRAIRYPTHTMVTKQAPTSVTPANPNSSPITEKM